MGFFDGMKSRPDKEIKAAREALNKGDDKAAISNYERALELAPKDHEIPRMLALLYGRNSIKLDRIFPLLDEAVQEWGKSLVTDSMNHETIYLRAGAIYQTLDRSPDLVNQLFPKGKISALRPSLDFHSSLSIHRIRYGDLLSYMWSEEGRKHWKHSEEKLRKYNVVLPSPEQVSNEDASILLSIDYVYVSYLDIGVNADKDDAPILAFIKEANLPYVDVAPWDVAWWLAIDTVNDLVSMVKSQDLKSMTLTLGGALESLMENHNSSGRKQDYGLYHLNRIFRPKPVNQNYITPQFGDWIEVAEAPPKPVRAKECDMGWFGENRQTQEQKQVQSWIEWSYGLLKMRMEVMNSQDNLHQKHDKLGKLSGRRLAEIHPSKIPDDDFLRVEHELLRTERIQNFSLFLLQHAWSAQAQEFGQLLLDMAYDRVKSDDEMAERFNKMLEMIVREDKYYADQSKREGAVKLEQPMSEDPIKQLKPILDSLSEVVAAKNTETVRWMTQIATRWGIDPNILT